MTKNNAHTNSNIIRSDWDFLKTTMHRFYMYSSTADYLYDTNSVI